MASTVRDVMTTDLHVMSGVATAVDAAAVMRDEHVGDVLVCDEAGLRGIVTDRDIAIRAVAGGLDPGECQLDEIATRDVFTVSPETKLDSVVSVVRDKTIRRIPVLEGLRPVGMVTLGDLGRGP